MHSVDTTDLPRILSATQRQRIQSMSLEWLEPAGQPVSHDTHFALINRYNRESAYRHLGLKAGQAFETTSQEYDYFLEVLPPMAMTSGSFACGEMTTASLVDSYHRLEDRFFCVTIEWHGRHSLYPAWAGLLDTIMEPKG